MSTKFDFRMTIFSGNKEVLSEIVENHFKNGMFKNESFEVVLSEHLQCGNQSSWKIQVIFSMIEVIPIVSVNKLFRLYPDCPIMMEYNSELSNSWGPIKPWDTEIGLYLLNHHSD